VLNNSQKQALVILVGVTADKFKCKTLYNYFCRNSSFDVYLPNLPQRLGLSCCEVYLKSYLKSKIIRKNYEKVHFLNYISGGIVFRNLLSNKPNDNLGRIIYVRSPIQEMVPKALVEKYGKLIVWILQGQMILDLTKQYIESLNFPYSTEEQGLIIEKEVSILAKALGLSVNSVPEICWEPERLLPKANDVIDLPLSHDEVYSSPELLSLALAFFQKGRFKEPIAGENYG